MNSSKVFGVSIFTLVLSISVVCQNSTANRNSPRYPNELKGYEAMSLSRLKTLIPGVSTEADVLKVFGDWRECGRRHDRLGVCELDENWNVSFTFDGETDSGILWSIEFYPRRQTPFSKVRFPKTFEKDELMIVHLGIEVETFISYSDKYGLSYVIANEKGDHEFRKGDLFYIEYGLEK